MIFTNEIKKKNNADFLINLYVTALLGWHATQKLLKECPFKDKKLKLRLFFSNSAWGLRIFQVCSNQ